MPPAKYNDRRYRRAVEHLKRTADPVCWICGQEIDLSLDYRDANAWTADHIAPMATGGDLLGELRPAHRGCNSRRSDGRKHIGNGQRGQRTEPTSAEQFPNSRDWHNSDPFAPQVRHARSGMRNGSHFR